MDRRGDQLVSRLVDDRGVAQVEIRQDGAVRGVVIHAGYGKGRDSRFAVQVVAGYVEVHVGLYSRCSTCVGTGGEIWGNKEDNKI